MKKSAVFLALILLLAFCSVPCFAEIQWPPPNYDMPRTVLSESSFDYLSESLKISYGALSSTGLRIAGVVFSVCLISGIFLRLFLDKLNLYNSVWKREFHRKVKAEDRRRNLDSIVDDRVAEMEIGLLAKARFRLRNPLADLIRQIRQSASAIRNALTRNPYTGGRFQRQRVLNLCAAIRFCPLKAGSPTVKTIGFPKGFSDTAIRIMF